MATFNQSKTILFQAPIVNIEVIIAWCNPISMYAVNGSKVTNQSVFLLVMKPNLN